MHSQVAPVTEDDGIRVLSFSVIANPTGRVLRGKRGLGVGDEGTGGRDATTHEIEPLLLEPIHNDLEQLVRDRVRVLLSAFSIEVLEPFLVCGRA
jgi:hypothetical protein